MSCLSPEQSLLVRRNKILAPLLVEEEEEEEEEKAHEVSNPASFLWHCTHANKEVEFAKLNVYSKQYPKHYDYPHLNRFRELPALLNSRVVLNNGDCEYINANFLPVRSKGGGLILTQAPLDHTVEHFWTMCIEQKVSLIVQLNEDDPVNYLKCRRCEVIEKVQLDHNWIQRTLRVDNKRVTHIQCLDWEDGQGLKLTPTFLQVVDMVLSEQGCVVVHCVAGIGRSGTFAAICTMMDRAKQAIYTTPYAVVNELRRYRMDVVKTIGQYRMIYEVMTFWMTLPSGEEGKAEE